MCSVNISKAIRMNEKINERKETYLLCWLASWLVAIEFCVWRCAGIKNKYKEKVRVSWL